MSEQSAGPLAHPDHHHEAPVSQPTTHRSTAHGIDHVGLTVPDIEAATRFFVDAFGAEHLYDAFPKTGELRGSASTTERLGVAPDEAERAIRMIALPNGPGIELFEFAGPSQHGAATPADLGWQHVAMYVDDVDAALAAVEAAGGTRNADPRPLGGDESGDGNRFVYARTPWGSTVELVSYPSRQPYLDDAPREKWRV